MIADVDYRGVQLYGGIVIHNHDSPQDRSSLLLLIGGKLLQLIKRDLVQGLLVRSVQEDLGHDLLALWVVLVCIKGFSPSTLTISLMLSRIITLRYINVSTYLVTQRHHLQPPFMPGMGRRSLPCLALKSKNSSVTSAATAWLP